MTKHIRLFNRISFFYGWFFRAQKKHYLNRVIPKLPFVLKGLKIIDLGAGTGALSSAMKEKGADVLMVDGSEKMLAIAKKKQGKDALPYRIADVLHDPLDDLASVDVVISAYMAHGLVTKDRFKLYETMKRLSQKYIVFYEHRKTNNLFIKFIEYLEGGDYFNYVVVAEKELREYFGHLHVIPVSKRSTLYVIENNFKV